jgi:predicted DNA-binding protein YlxM (UPF0122 family)
MRTQKSDGYKDKETLENLYNSDYDMRDIAEEFDIALGTVQHWMDKFDIERCGGSAGYDYAKYSVNKGYPRWSSQREYIFVHRLLAVAEYGFESVCDKQVHHKNGIRWDNRPSNIELMNEHSHMSYHWSGESNPQSKLTQTEVAEIKNRYKEDDVSQSDLAEEYNVTQTSISRVVNGKRWG